MLSIGGWVVLLNVVLSSIPLYYMSLFILPSSVRHNIDYSRKHFFWNGPARRGKKYHLMSQGQVCKPKGSGGLGVLDLRMFNLALMAKQFWHPLTRPEGSFQKLLIAKYCPTAGSWNAKHRNPLTASGFWKGMLVSKSIMCPSLKHKVGDGHIASFWYGRLYKKIPLKTLFSEQFEVVRNKDAVVTKYWGRARQRFQTNTAVTGRAREQLGEIR